MASPTFQDYEAATDTAAFIAGAIGAHKACEAYRTALSADEYDHQRNETINEYIRVIYGANGVAVEDFTAANNRIASNFFNRLNTQRVMYSLGNGLSFVQPDEHATADDVKEKMGPDFDKAIADAAYYACIHGSSFVFWNIDRAHVFKLIEFVPLFDETDGRLRAGIRFWQLDESKPMRVTFYREDGYSDWAQDDRLKLVPLDADGNEAEAEVLTAYKTTVAWVPADGDVKVVGEENYGSLPIVPMWASRLKQSTLVGMRAAIDAYDLVKSGFANDMQDCATVYWIVRNAGGMTESDLAKFRDDIKFHHIAHVDGMDGAGAEPYTQDVPYQAREVLLRELRDGLYEDFGALDVHTVAAGATNDHIDAAYQPMDENASDFEYWVGKCVKQLLALNGVEDEPMFTRQRISNQKEQVEMVVQEAQWLDTATILRKLPNIDPAEVAAILEGMEGEDMQRFGVVAQEEPEEVV